MSNLKAFFGTNQPSSSEDGEHWLTVSDLMAGLMMVFLFIAIVYMRDISIEKDKIEDVAVAYQENQVAIYEALNSEFEYELDAWKASVDKETLSFQFNSPEVLFDSGESSLKPEFEEILVSFIPRYLEVLEQFKESIDEVRIEGHTSSEWGIDTNPDEAYFMNMALSQNRTRSVLNFAYLETGLSDGYKSWVKHAFSAVGLASAKAKLNSDGSENKQLSRRVSFRVITNADIQIRKIIEGI